jgi:S1-C subfamily serine protease
VAGRNTDSREHSFLIEPHLWKIGPPASGTVQEGDVLTAIDGLPITSRSGGRRLASVLPGEQVTLRIRRGGREVLVQVTASATCEAPSIQLTDVGGPPEEVSRRMLAAIDGLRGHIDSGGGPDSPRGGRAPSPFGGDLGFAAELRTEVLTVTTNVRSGSPAARAGLRAGDVVLTVDGLDVSSPEALARLRARAGRPVRLGIRRDGQLLFLTIRPDRS